jgi:hypothetical protein
MPADTATIDQPVTKPAEVSVSFSDALDAALGTSEPTVTTPPTAEAPKPAETAPVQEVKTEAQPAEKSEPKTDSKTPSFILEELGKIGSTEKSSETKATAEAEAKAEAVEEKLPDNAPPAAQTAFAKLTKELKEAKTKLKEMETKVTERTDAVEKKGGDVQSDTQLKELQTKLEQFTKEREELEGELRLSRIEATREYKTAISEPTKAAVQAISEIAKVYEVRPSTILEAVNETDGAKRRTLLKELTGDMDAADALAVRMKVDELIQLNGKRDEMVRESKSTLEAMTKAEEEQERTERAKYDAEAKKAFGEVWDTFQKELPLLKKIDGNDQWNKTIDEIRVHAEKLDAEPLDHRQRAALTYQAVTLPLVVQVFKDYVAKTNQEMASLKSNLSEYRKATPNVGAGQTLDKNEKADPGLGFLEALEKGF